jgi:hypothetical protein
MVRIGPMPFRRTHPAFGLVLAAWLALLSYVSSLLPGPAGTLVPALLAAGSLAAVVGGARGLAAWLARPAETNFQAQVIARWVEHRGSNDDDSYIPCIAVDDGERSWSFDVSRAVFGQLALGDMVGVHASPRSGKLLDLVPGPAAADAGRPGPAGEADLEGPGSTDGPGPAGAVDAAVAADDAGLDTDGSSDAGAGRRADAAGPAALLAAEEVSAIIGRPVRATGFAGRAARMLYCGEGITVIMTAADGRLSSLSSGLAQRRGNPLPGIGDEAWLLNHDRTVVFRVGGMAAKITLGGSVARTLPPDVLTRLAATVAGRLTARPVP